MSTDPDIATAARALLEALDAHEDVAGPDAFAVYSLAAADAVFDAKSALRDAIAADLRAAREEVERLRGELAETQATIANERGEGEPPEERCVWDPACRQWKLVAGGKEIGFVSRGYQTRWAWEVCVGDRWLHGYALTARAAIRAAAKAVRGES